LAKRRAYRFALVLSEGDNYFMRGLGAEVEAVKQRSAADRTYKVPPFEVPRWLPPWIRSMSRAVPVSRWSAST